MPNELHYWNLFQFFSISALKAPSKWVKMIWHLQINIDDDLTSGHDFSILLLSLSLLSFAHSFPLSLSSLSVSLTLRFILIKSLFLYSMWKAFDCICNIYNVYYATCTCMVYVSIDTGTSLCSLELFLWYCMYCNLHEFIYLIIFYIINDSRYP